MIRVSTHEVGAPVSDTLTKARGSVVVEVVVVSMNIGGGRGVESGGLVEIGDRHGAIVIGTVV